MAIIAHPLRLLSRTQHRFQILRPVNDADNLEWLGRRIVNDEVGIDRPEFERPAGEVFSNVAHPRLRTQKYNRIANIVEDAPLIRGPACWMR